MNENKKSDHLRIQIKRQETVTVDLTFPIFTLTVIDNFIPEKAQAYLNKSNINLEQILDRAKETNYIPQSILDFDHEEKHFSIWIE